MLQASANSDGPGLLDRGREFQPWLPSDLASATSGDGSSADREVFVGNAVLRLARLAGSVADALRDHPEPDVRRAAALLAARAHPLRVALDD